LGFGIYQYYGFKQSNVNRQSDPRSGSADHSAGRSGRELWIGHQSYLERPERQSPAKYRTEIILDSMIMLDKKEGGGSYQPSAPSQPKAEASQPEPQAPASEEVNIEEIPF